jgi:serine phosphatase RsbU (regulator of sigma subunit)
VSGDFYDFFEMEGGKLGIVVGDGTGKGVPAALVLATTRSVLRATASQFSSPGEVLERTNNLLCEEMPANMFVTCLFIILDPVEGRLIIGNAGHNLPNLCGRGGIQELRATGMPLGLLPGMKYEEIQCTMARGERLLLYSDGLVEAHDPHGIMYGIPRLYEKLQDRYREPSNGNASSLVRYLYDDLQQFTGPEWEQEDDVTLLVLARDQD